MTGLAYKGNGNGNGTDDAMMLDIDWVSFCLRFCLRIYPQLQLQQSGTSCSRTHTNKQNLHRASGTRFSLRR